MGWTVYNSDGKILQSAELGDNAVTSAKIADGAILNADINASAAIDATKIADGSVTSTEFQYINTLSSNAQTQLAAKQATIDSSARLDAASIGANGNVSNTEYGYLSGVTSDIQTQITAANSAASTTAAGIAELAISTEVNTGTSATLAVTPDSLAGSVYGEKNIQMIVVDWGIALTTGDGKFYFYVPATLNGFHVVSAHAAMISAPAGSAVLVNVSKVGIDDIFDDRLQIAAGTIVSIDSGSGVWTLDSTHKILATGQILRVDVDQVGSSTAGSGLYINLTCRLP